jgi:5-methylthioadenosine/S-adenosylhomocysteine deaminase
MLECVTEAPARAIGWPELGTLGLGHPADLAIIALDTLEMAGSAAPPGDVLHRLLRTYSGSPVRDLFVGGRAVVTDGKLAGVDAAIIVAQADASARRLYSELTEPSVRSE